MSRFQGNIFFNPIFLLTLLLLAGGAVFLLGRSGKADGGQVEITVFTNPGATTPVLPLFYLAQEGRIPEARFNFRYWNSPVTLQSMMLAGDGVLWIGQTESLLKARDAGAPLRILAVTGWRKWQIVSRLHGKNFPADFCPDGRLDFAPPGAAGKLLVEKLLAGEGTELKFVPHELQSLMLRLVEGRCHTAMLPEPFATTILERLPDLKIVTSAEKLYAAATGGDEAVPWAAIAVNTNWENEHPEMAAALEREILAAGKALTEMSAEKAMAYWQGESKISRDGLVRSLERDLIRVRPAAQCEEIIREYLELIREK